jgi:hypothetical protein
VDILKNRPFAFVNVAILLALEMFEGLEVASMA